MTSSACYGYLTGLITAASLQPLDNIKMTLMIPPTHLQNKLNLSSNFFVNIFNIAKFMKIQEGLASFYKGLTANLFKTGFGSAIYFYVLRSIQNANTNSGTAGSFMASSIARVISSVLTNPLSIAQTRYQIIGQNRWSGNLAKNLLVLYKNQGINSLFKGCTSSCLKEAGFAGLYYSLYQEGKKMGFSSLVSGMSAGIISTVSTHPLQIIRTKTQAQTSGVKLSIIGNLAFLAKQGSFLDGVAPRLIKKPLANTICFLLFQYFQKIEREGNKF